MLRRWWRRSAGNTGLSIKKGRPLPTVGLQVPDGREPNAPDIATPNPSHHHSQDTLEPFAEEEKKKNQGRSNLDQGVRGGVKQDGDAVGLQEQKIEICFMLVGPGRRAEKPI